MIYNIVIVVGIYLVVVSREALTNQEADDESDDAKLEQALMMVEILKSEYIKLLRDNMALRKGDLDNTSAEVEQSTCAANGSSAMDVTTVSILNEIKQASKDAVLPAHVAGSSAAPAYEPPAPLSSQPPLLYQKPLPLHHNYFRRRIPEYYYYDMFRRQFYNEPIESPMVGPRRDFMSKFRRPMQPGPDLRRFNYGVDPFYVTPTAIATSSANLTGSSSTIVLAQKSTVRPATALPPRPSAVMKPRRATPRPAHHTAVAMLGRRTTRLNALRTLSSVTRPSIHKENARRVEITPRDPLAAEVASELIKELEQGVARRDYGELVSDFPFRPTTKIFLEKSTRYPLPLPENHAFCFTNPNNRLCKTSIK